MKDIGIKFESKFKRNIKWLKRDGILYAFFALPFIWFLIFHYLPMIGLYIGFTTEYEVGSGIKGFFLGEWNNFAHIKSFVTRFDFWKILRNTLMINLFDILINFPAPIILALLFNELLESKLRKTAQTIVYLPRFISTVIIVSIYTGFLRQETGLINNIREFLGLERIPYLGRDSYFWILITLMNTWALIGWHSIIYLAAMSSINTELYEAADLDGANRLNKMIHITLPSIANTIIIMFILRVGAILTINLEPILLLIGDNKLLYETGLVIPLHVYNEAFAENINYSYATAVGFFQSVIGFILVVIANRISNKVAEFGLW